MKTASLVISILIFALRLPAQTNQSLHVAVLDSPAASEFAIGLADFIEAGLQKEGVATYDRHYLRVLLAERELDRSGVIDLKTMQAARLPAMDLFVSGEVHPVGTNQFVLTLEAVRAADALMAVSLHAEGQYPQEWLSTLERLLREMSGKLGANQSATDKIGRGRAITWMPEASLWFFRGLECYVQDDYPQAVLAFGKARRWDSHFRTAWLWESRSYQRMGLPAQARRVLEAAQLSDQSFGQAMQRPVIAVVAGKGVTDEDKQAFAGLLASNSKVSVLDPRWIGASAREADLQFTGEMAARTEAGNAWLMVDQVIFLERDRPSVWLARQQDALTGQVQLRAKTPATTNGLNQLAQKFMEPAQHNTRRNEPAANVETSRNPPVFLPLNPAETKLSRYLDRVRQNPTDVRALLAAADACQAWEGDVLYRNGQREHGVEWLVREEFLAQAVEVIRRNPGQKDASFWLASALWRQRYRPEYSIWAGSVSGTPLREHMKPLLEMFPQSADAINLSETITENITHNRRSMPTDARYLQSPFPAEMPSPKVLTNESNTAKGEACLTEFRALVAQKRFARASLLFWDLPSADHSQDQVFQAENQAFQKLMMQDQQTHDAFMHELGLAHDPQQLTELMTGWNPSFTLDNRHQEIFGLCDQIAKLSGSQAERRFVDEQFRRYLADYGTLPMVHGSEPNPVLARLRSDADALVTAGHFEDAELLYERIIRTPEVPADTRHTTAYDLAIWYSQRTDYFRATELLRELLADDSSGSTILSWTANNTYSVRDAAYALLKHIRLFEDGELDFSRCCGELPAVPPADSAALDALEKLFRERMSLTLSIGQPTAEKMNHTRQEMKRVEQAIFNQHGDALPAFLQQKIKESGPGPETMGLCAKLGSKALPLLPQIVASVRQHDNRSTQCNALWALANIGHPAACALPVVILALESDDATMVQPAAHLARKKLGVAPRQTMSFLARLLYHPNPLVASKAADALFATAKLPASLRIGLNDEEFVQRVQRWWENTGSFQPEIE